VLRVMAGSLAAKVYRSNNAVLKQWTACKAAVH
jgi:hypothetical protein